MIRREYLLNMNEKKKTYSMVDYELEKIKKEDDDNYIIENYRPLKEGDIRKLSKPILDKFVDKLLVNPLQVKFLYSTNAKSEIKLVNKANIANKKNQSLDKKKVSLCGAKDLRKMREKYEVINIVKGEVENKKKRDQDENSVKAKKNEEFFKRIKTNPCLSETNLEKDKNTEKRLKKVFHNIENKLKKIKLPDVKLDNNDVFSRLYHNAVYINDRSSSQIITTSNIKNLDDKIFKVKNVIESSSGKEFSTKITDEIVAMCYGKHTGGPFFKNTVNSVKSPTNISSQLMSIKLEDGNTLLHHCVFYELMDLVNYLIDKKIEINVKNNYGDTPLHYAIQNNNKEIIQLLLDNGADLTIRNNKNKNPFDIAEHDIRKTFNLENRMNTRIKLRYFD